MSFWNRVTEQANEKLKQGREQLSQLQQQAATPKPLQSPRASQGRLDPSPETNMYEHRFIFWMIQQQNFRITPRYHCRFEGQFHTQIQSTALRQRGAESLWRTCKLSQPTPQGLPQMSGRDLTATARGGGVLSLPSHVTD